MLRYGCITILCLSMVFSCTMNGKWAEQVNWDTLDFNALPGKEEYPDAPAIILYDKGVVDVVGNGETGYTHYERHKIIKILTPAGVNYANVSIPYGSSSRIESIHARTIAEDGTITVLDPSKIYDVNLYPNFMFYSDQRAKIFTFPAVAKGAVIEYRYSLAVEGRSIVSSWSFQDYIPTLQSQFELQVPSSWELNHKVYGIPLEPDIITTPQGFKSKYTWKSGELPAISNEFGMPPQRELGARLDIAPVGIENWQDVSDWYHELCSSRMEAGPEIKKIVAGITKDLETDQDKMKAIYEWVREQVRYIAVSIGIGGYQPHFANEIFLNRYGDCKDMSTLLVTMAKEAGITTHQVLISTKQNGMPDTSIASPYHFNHVIAYAPDLGESGIWMDATEKGSPFGTLPWYNQGLPVLVVKDDQPGEVVMTPVMPAEKNSVDIYWSAELDRKGRVLVSGQSFYSGAMASELREDLFYTNKRQRRKWLERYVVDFCSGAVLDSSGFSGLDSIADPLKLAYRFRAGSFVSKLENKMILRPYDIFRMELPDYFRSLERENPIRFKFGLKRAFTLSLDIPPNWMVKSENRKDSVETKYGKAMCSLQSSGGHLKMVTEYVLNGHDIDESEYLEFREFLEDVRRIQRKEIVLDRKPVRLP